jgi:predicted AlkP superfamily pyrophosphatase or phosphodiesterase
MIARALLLCGLLTITAVRGASPLILISLDGFRWDYPELYAAETPTLGELKRHGTAARGLIPVFPSNTFPNHYTLVTGMYPSRHGILNNDFFDSDAGRFFRSNQPALARESRWWGGEPIWVTAVRQRRQAATAFWVGSEAAIHGLRPTFWKPFDYSTPFAQRLEELIGWLKLPAAQRPALVTFYLEESNSTGHTYGPRSPEMRATARLLDRQLAAMLGRLRGEGIEPNLVLVSDHGMTEVDQQRIVILEDHLDLTTAQVDFDGSVVGLRPTDGNVAALLRQASRIPHADAYCSGELPAHFRLADTPRNPPVWVVPHEGAHVVLRSTRERLARRYSASGYVVGDHGYDPALPSMHGIFIASGPAFRAGVEIPAVENVHVYNLLCAVLGVPPAPNDGDDRLVQSALRP